VNVHGADGQLTVQRHVGALSLSLPQGEADGQLVSVRVYGLGPTLGGLALGYAKADAAILGPDCRLVVWADESTDLAALRAAVKDIPQVCLGGAGVAGQNKGVEGEDR